MDMERVRNLCSAIINDAHRQPPIISTQEGETNSEDTDLLIGGEAEHEARLLGRCAPVLKSHHAQRSHLRIDVANKRRTARNPH